MALLKITLEKQLHTPCRNRQYSKLLIRENLETERRIPSKEENPGCLFCLRLNDEGDLLASTTADCVQVWDFYSGRLLHSLREHTEIVTCITWFHSHDSNSHTFFTSSLDKSIKLWKNFQVVTTYKEHNDWIRCLALSSSNDVLVSGCVSSHLYGWDVASGSVLFKIPNAHHSPSFPELNTINSLHFAHSNKNLFVSGARDGIVKLWDQRCLSKPTHSFQAHNAKLNVVTWSGDDCRVLSSGRDSSIRLWDMRTIGSDVSQVPERGSSGLLMEYNAHTCAGYNVGTCFFDDERHLATGSEDNKIYIYDVFTGSTAKVLEGHNSVVHLVHACDRNPLCLVSSSIESCSMLVWSPQSKGRSKKLGVPASVKQGTTGHRGLDDQRTAIEALMKEHGDQILKIFHKFNLTFSSPLDWNALMNDARSKDDSDLLQQVERIARDFSRVLSDPPDARPLQPNTNHNEVNRDEESKEIDSDE